MNPNPYAKLSPSRHRCLSLITCLHKGSDYFSFYNLYIFCTFLALPQSWHAELCQCGLDVTISPPIHIVSQLLHFPLGLDLTSESFPAQPSERPLPVTRAGSEVEMDLPSLLWKAHQTKLLCLTETFLEYFVLSASPVLCPEVQMPVSVDFA